MLGLHHSQVASIDQRKSFPVLSQSLGCIVRANILFSRFLCSHLWQLAIILVQPEDIGCSSRFMDFWICCREIFSRHWISVAERNISGEIFSGSVAQEYFLVTHQFPRTRNIFTPIWVLQAHSYTYMWYSNAPLTCVDSPCIAVYLVQCGYICVLGGGTMALH